MKKSNFKNHKGGALVMVMIVMVVLMILGTAILGMAVAESKFTSRHENKIQAYYIARSGAQAIAEYMIRDAHNDASEIIDKDYSAENSQIDGGKFKVKVTKDNTTKRIYITSIGEYGGVEQEAKIRLNPSSSGAGGIFEYALVAKNGISTSNNGGTGIAITGDIATQSGTISLGKHGKVINGTARVKNDLTFPPIVEPVNRTPKINYDYNLGTINYHNTSGPSIGAKTTPTYVKTKSIELKKSTIKITGKGVVHMYVNGDISMDTQSYFDVGTDAKLYIYVIGERSIEFTGRGNQNNIVLYAPDSSVVWNNAGSGNFVGSIIGKSIELHNDTVIKYNKDMVNDIDLDNTGSGVTYTGYTWID